MPYCIGVRLDKLKAKAIERLINDLLAGTDVIFARIELVNIALLILSEESDAIDLGDSHRGGDWVMHTSIELRCLDDDLVSDVVGCFWFGCSLDQFHMLVLVDVLLYWCSLVAFGVSADDWNGLTLTVSGGAKVRIRFKCWLEDHIAHVDRFDAFALWCCPLIGVGLGHIDIVLEFP